MKIFLLPALLALCLSACAQQNDLDRFYDKYKSNDALAGEVSISPSLWLSTSFSGKDADSWKDKLSNVRLLILDGKDSPALLSDVDKLSRRLLGDDAFDDLLDIRKGKSSVRLLVKDIDGHIRDVVLLIRGDDNGVVFAQLRGRFSDKDLASIRGSLE
jgi:hypothetical protein